MADNIVSGGDKFRAHVRQMQQSGGARSVEVGFFGNKDEPSGLNTVQAALIHEFGVGDHKETAFFRQAIRSALPAVHDYLARHTHGHVSQHQADQIGQHFADHIRRSIKEHGLVDSGTLMSAVEYKVHDDEE